MIRFLLCSSSSSSSSPFILFFPAFAQALFFFFFAFVFTFTCTGLQVLLIDYRSRFCLLCVLFLLVQSLLLQILQSPT